MKEFIEKLVSRLEEEIDIIKDEVYRDYEERIIEECAIENVIDIVNELAEGYITTSTDTSSGWISVSGKLPNDMEKCLVTLENGCVMFATYIIDEFMSPIGHFVEGNKPIAWMPLPAPYKEGVAENE